MISEDGWTKKGMQRMMRLDSFLRESSRINAVTLSTPLSPLLRPLNQHKLMWPTPHLASLNRYALRDYTFQDGTFIPKGTFVTASLHSLHMNDGTYEDAEKFDPWRFVEKGANGEVFGREHDASVHEHERGISGIWLGKTRMVCLPLSFSQAICAILTD